jgi:hypothetical protein
MSLNDRERTLKRRSYCDAISAVKRVGATYCAPPPTLDYMAAETRGRALKALFPGSLELGGDWITEETRNFL